MELDEVAVKTILVAGARLSSKQLRLLTQQLTFYEVGWAEWWADGASRWQATGVAVDQTRALLSFAHRYTPEEYQEFLLAKGYRTLTADSDQYPLLLKECPDKPEVLFVKGSLPHADLSVAIVGSRKMTPYGQQVINHFIPSLCFNQAVIISGFMYGVDATAHAAALAAGGRTVGVLGYGFEYLSVSCRNPHLASLLEQNMCLVSEFPPEYLPQPWSFPQRNRIIAGLSQATVVVEAALKSGSLITAQYALEYNRIVMAVPGSITNPSSKGVIQLLNDGALAVDSADAILSEISPQIKPRSQSKPDSQSLIDSAKKLELEQEVILLLRSTSLSTDELMAQLSQPLDKVLPKLSLLELQGKVSQQWGKWFLTCQSQ
ncbi:MAG: DNA-processing protein DprA [bacterium]|nr:DNA-processing protein DprA [bacterium]